MRCGVAEETRSVPVAGKNASEDLQACIVALKESPEEPWEKIWARFFPADSGYVLNYTRSDFKMLLPLTQDSDVLEIGSSVGQICLPVASSVRSVWGLEADWQQAVIARLIADKKALSNVHIACGGTNGLLPYPDQSFDIVIMNNVLEWVVARADNEDPLVIQKRILSEIRRVLKQGGSFFIATKNRFSLSYLSGQPDEHVQMRFGSALPRAVLKKVLDFRKNPLMVRVHSLRSLNQLIAYVGLKVQRNYWVIPDVRCPKFYVPLSLDMIRYVRRSPFIRNELPRRYRIALRMLPAALFRYLIYSFCFLGGEDERATSC